MFGGPGVVTGVRVAHQRATVEEITAAGAASQRAQVSELLGRDGVEEAFALQTCNRAEAYVVTADAARGREALADFAPSVRDEAVVRTGHEESLRHLLRVAAGLESLVIGEDHVLGQVREAYQDALGAGGVGPTLEEAVTKAIHVGERVRAETDINEGVVSLGSAAASVAVDDGGVAGATAAVVGAGEMGSVAAEALSARDPAELVVVNRTVPHAEHVAEAVDCEAGAAGLAALDAVLERADVAVCTTASDEPLVEPEDLAGAGPTTLVDIAQPRDVAPEVAELAHVSYYGLDDLESVTERTRERRREAAAEVESTIDEELDHLLERYKRKRADEVVAAMYEGAEAVKDAELDRAFDQLEAAGELTDEQREAVESMADALVNKLLAPPTRSLRDAAAEDDWTTIHTALRLFDPGFDGDAPVPPGAADAAGEEESASPASDD